MPPLLLATGNQHKVVEMSALLGDLGVTIRAAHEFPDGPDVVEDGDTYEANAILKARAWADHTRLWTLADDSGLEVDALDGRPGMYSSRYAPTNEERIAGILRELDGAPEERRGARFVCVMALASPDGRIETRRGECEGRIALAPSGRGGFGYDPIFHLPERGCSMAEIGEDEKNRISHRARAAQAIRPVIAARMQCP
jgi:XTP/dITP diphosphohydrolase